MLVKSTSLRPSILLFLIEATIMIDDREVATISTSFEVFHHPASCIIYHASSIMQSSDPPPLSFPARVSSSDQLVGTSVVCRPLNLQGRVCVTLTLQQCSSALATIVHNWNSHYGALATSQATVHN